MTTCRDGHLLAEIFLSSNTLRESHNFIPVVQTRYFSCGDSSG
jgi:hypothetical protein